MRIILVSFFVILLLWILDCLVIDFDIEAVYLMGSLVIWMFICYFIYRHESVIDELTEQAVAPDLKEISDDDDDKLRKRIRHLFDTEHIYLNPQLKLSDVASLTNSNRTYISRFFNNSQGKTFFEFVNEYRVDHAKALLAVPPNNIAQLQIIDILQFLQIVTYQIHALLHPITVFHKICYSGLYDMFPNQMDWTFKFAS